ncbi:MAG: tRNA preQ1(34) S-adenosylmethionine ribosyltransferase-isomerase QueA [Rhizobiaceae bacterium]
MRVDDFDFELPEDRIALRPAVPRDSSKMLVVNAPDSDGLVDASVHELAHFLRKGDLLVFNDTKVIPAQLSGVRRRGDAESVIEATLHMRVAADRWRAFVRGAKKLRPGDAVDFCDGSIAAKVVDKFPSGDVEFHFALSGRVLDQALVEHGNLPLPPYIAAKRKQDGRDRVDYQTIYAREQGAVAAPTAGLHFTPELMEKLAKNGIGHCFVTLHVGAGTFLPVKVDDTDDHIMHHEIGTISPKAAAAINKCKSDGGRVISVGTTSLRLLESAADESGTIQSWSGSTDIFITPGYRFRAIDALMTNFHLPRSTLFMLVSAFAGTAMMRSAYDHALQHGYRFYSYGDSSLLFPQTKNA